MDSPRNVRRRRPNTNLEAHTHRDDDPGITVYHTQRVQARTQRHRGVSEFLSNMGAVLNERARNRVINQAESDALSGDVDPELAENNWLYRGIIHDHQGRAEGIKLASQSQAQLEQAFAQHRQHSPDAPFDIDGYLDQHFGTLDENPLWGNQNYRDSVLKVRQRLADEMAGTVSRMEARATVEEANEAFLNFTHNAMESANVATLGDMREMIVAVGDDLGMTNKDIRASITEAYLTKMGQSADRDEVKQLEDDLRGWLRGVDRGFLRGVEEHIQRATSAAESRISGKEMEAREARLDELDRNYMQVKFGIRDNPFDVSHETISQLREAGELGLDEAENRRRALQLHNQLDQALRSTAVRNMEAAANEAVFNNIGPIEFLAAPAETRQAFQKHLNQEAEAAVAPLFSRALSAATRADEEYREADIGALVGELRELRPLFERAAFSGTTLEPVTSRLAVAAQVYPENQMIEGAALLFNEMRGLYGAAAVRGLNNEQLANLTGYHQARTIGGMDHAAAMKFLDREDTFSTNQMNAMLDRAGIKRDVETFMDELVNPVAERRLLWFDRKDISPSGVEVGEFFQSMVQYNLGRNLRPEDAVANARAIVESNFTYSPRHNQWLPGGIPEMDVLKYDIVSDTVYDTLRTDWGISMSENNEDLYLIPIPGGENTGEFYLADRTLPGLTVEYPGGSPVRINLRRETAEAWDRHHEDLMAKAMENPTRMQRFIQKANEHVSEMSVPLDDYPEDISLRGVNILSSRPDISPAEAAKRAMQNVFWGHRQFNNFINHSVDAAIGPVGSGLESAKDNIIDVLSGERQRRQIRETVERVNQQRVENE